MPYIDGFYYPEGNEMTVTIPSTTSGRIYGQGINLQGDRSQLEWERQYLNRWRNWNRLGQGQGSQLSMIVALAAQGMSYTALVATFGAAAVALASMWLIRELDDYWDEKLQKMYGDEAQWAYEFTPRFIEQTDGTFEISTDGGNTYEPLITNKPH